jgi:molybdate transport system substrate-binding protein
MRSRLAPLAVTAAAATAAAAGLGACGSPVDPAATGRSGDLRVVADASLQRALTHYARAYAGAPVQVAVAKSGDVENQIRSDQRPDVLASADTKLAAQLYDDGLVEKPRTFTTNRLVLAVRRNATKVRALDDLSRSGVRIAMGAPGLPVGTHARTVLARLKPAERRRVTANVVARPAGEQALVSQVIDGHADVALAYLTDVIANGRRLRAIRLPRSIEPHVTYAAAIVKDAKNERPARAFVSGLGHGVGANALRIAGFGAVVRR